MKSTLLFVVFIAVVARVAAQPNFVIFAADDLGYDDLGIHGNLDAETPVLDQLARDAVQFKRFYVAPVCAPTRASLYTGRHFLRTGVWGVHGTRDYLNLNEQTFANALRAVGYKTGLFGKWHNGLTDGYLPWDRGFEEACMVELYKFFNNQATCNGRSMQTSGWATERITDWTIDFIKRHKDSPFAVMVPFMTPHLGKTYADQSEYWHVPERYAQKYLNKGLSDQLSKLYGMIEFMDYNIGRVLEAIKAEGLEEQTVLMFLSDNGPIGRHLMSVEDWQRRNVHRLRGNKGDVFENGIRVPFFVRWTGHYAPRIEQTAFVTVEDIFPTLMELAGISVFRNPLDGISLVPLLSNASHGDDFWNNRVLYHTKAAPDWTLQNGIYTLLPAQGRDKSGLVFGEDGAWAVHRGPYKYISHFGVRNLFNVDSDPQERVNIDDISRMHDMDNLARAWWDDILADPGSFARPQFYIGRTDVSRFYMMGAIETSSNIIVRSHNVEGHLTSGNELKYRAIVAAAGNYTVTIEQWRQWQGAMTVDVYCGENRATANGEVIQDFITRIEIPFKGDDCVVQLKIQNGRGWFQAATFTFNKSA